MDDLECLNYSAFTLAITAMWVHRTRKKSLSVVSMCRAVPGLCSFYFTTVWSDYLEQILAVNEIERAIQYSVVAVVVSLLMTGICVVVSLTLHWGTWETQKDLSPRVKEGLRDLLSALWKAAIEEIGWRCFLLPCLMAIYPPRFAFFLCGLACSLCQIPANVVISVRNGHLDPVLSIVTLATSRVMISYPLCWLALKSRYSMWASTVLTWLWNRFNKRFLGSIQAQTNGKIVGRQWLINGEGVLGCLVMLPIVILIFVDLGRWSYA